MKYVSMDQWLQAWTVAASRQRLAVTAVLLVILPACASLNVQKGQDIATSGIQYAKAVETLIDVATDAMIDADSDAMIRSKLPAAALTEATVAELKQRLAVSDAGLVANTRSFISLHASLSAIESYFSALQNLADNPRSDVTASEVSTLSDRVNSLNAALKQCSGDLKPVISTQEKAALSGLSKLVADQVHGAKVAAALRRDAEVIGEAFQLQERIIALAEPLIVGAMLDQNNIFYADKVEKPFGKQDIGATWASNRNTYIKTRAAGESSKELQAARQASRQMSVVWQKILAGVGDAGELKAQLAELETLTVAVGKLKQADKPKPNG